MQLKRRLTPLEMWRLYAQKQWTLAMIAKDANIGRERVRQLINLVRRRGSRASQRFDPRAKALR